MKPLFEKFPRADLAALPTPIIPLSQLNGSGRCRKLLMKQDNLSGTLYGGNKIRKLEFLLGEAVAEGRKSVITYGAVGSNHALATAVCCQQLGLRAISVLAPQEPSDHVRKNLLRGYAAGAQFHFCNDYTEFPEATRQWIEQCTAEDGVAPYIIPAGGSNATGALGFVNAVFELQTQNIPDVIYLPMGTGGTLAGLLVGFKLAGFYSHIEAIRVVDVEYKSPEDVLQLCNQICEKLNIPYCITAADLHIRDEFLGEGYGIPTEAGQKAVQQMKQQENIHLENTYTGKTVAALLYDLHSGALNNKTVLYWNTLNSQDSSFFAERKEEEMLLSGFRLLFSGDEVFSQSMVGCGMEYV